LGFIGSHFIELLLKRNHKVLNIDKISYASNKIDFNNHPNYSFLKEDIANLKEIPDCDFIINFAAESHVDNSILSSFEFINSNVLGVYNLLELIKNKKIRKLVKLELLKKRKKFLVSSISSQILIDPAAAIFLFL